MALEATILGSDRVLSGSVGPEPCKPPSRAMRPHEELSRSDFLTAASALADLEGAARSALDETACFPIACSAAAALSSASLTASLQVFCSASVSLDAFSAAFSSSVCSVSSAVSELPEGEGVSSFFFIHSRFRRCGLSSMLSCHMLTRASVDACGRGCWRAAWACACSVWMCCVRVSMCARAAAPSGMWRLLAPRVRRSWLRVRLCSRTVSGSLLLVHRAPQ